MGAISHCLGCALLEGAAATHKVLGKEGDCKEQDTLKGPEGFPRTDSNPLQPAHCTKEQGLCRSVTGLTALAAKF